MTHLLQTKYFKEQFLNGTLIQQMSYKAWKTHSNLNSSMWNEAHIKKKEELVEELIEKKVHHA